MKSTSSDAEQILQSMPIGFTHLDEDFRYLALNAEAERSARRPRAELLGRTVLEAFPSLRDGPIDHALRRARATREPQRSLTHFAETGKWHDARIVPQADGSFHLFVTEGEESERVAAEMKRLREALGRERRLYETVLGGTPDFAYVWSLDYKFLYANTSLLKLYGVPAEKCIGYGFRDVGYPEWHAAMHEREIDEVARTGQPLRGKIPFYGKGGGGIYDYIFVPVLGPDGKVEAVGGITRDVTDLERTTQALQEADRRKDEFLATLAHELRNPMAPLLTGLRVIGDAPDSDAAAVARGIMERQLNHMVHLVDDLLDLSRVSRGAIELRKARRDLRAVIATAIETARPEMDRYGHRLTVELGRDELPVDGDDTRLTQVFSNLLSNAVKYTPAGGSIDVAGAVEGGQAVITVTDSGIGIKEADLPRVFEMFTQIKNDVNPVQGGLGIGLHLVRRLVEMHQGTATAFSAGPGEGSVFTVRLPLASSAFAEAAGKASFVAVRARRILIVDDNVDAAFMLSLLLKNKGHDVHATYGAAEALDLARTFRPEVIFLDIGMPNLDGYEACRRLRQMDAVKHAYIVALTGWGQDENRRMAREAGFDAHLVKPASAERIDEMLAQAPERIGVPLVEPSAP
jgi:PAS domain S-box-containing protein